ncbi:MAG TPA: hypothetical protein VII72_23230 [Myxococcota bacterium]|jgi:uncharacterized membrane protein YccC
MASIRRQGDSFEIRECLSTDRGPRQRALARFRRVLTPEVLDQAEAAARRPFDRRALQARARQQGIPVAPERRNSEARKLLADLRASRPIDPTLVTLLRDALALLASEPLPSHLSDVAEWIGRSEADRGKALRGLLRTASRVLRSRRPLREPPPQAFPRFSSGGNVAA